MKLVELKNRLHEAYSNNSLLVPKHNPNNLETIFEKYRSVVSFEVAENLPKFIDVGIYKAFSFYNKNYPNSPLFIEIIPTIEYSIPSSGVTSLSPIPTSALDRIVLVDGRLSNIHIYGYSSMEINEMVLKGELINKTEII